MWIETVFAVYVTITSAEIEYDGSFNYLLETPDQLAHKTISFNSNNKLPFKTGEVFPIIFKGECEPVRRINRERSYICNADSIETKKGVFTDINAKKTKVLPADNR